MDRVAMWSRLIVLGEIALHNPSGVFRGSSSVVYP